MNPYPPRDKSHLVQRVEGLEAAKYSRDWTGNDKSARNHTIVVCTRFP